MGYQFLHIEVYGRKGAHKKNSSSRKSSMYDIRDEMIRAPHACSHVVRPLAPTLLFGMTPQVAFTLAEERAAQANDKRGHRLRNDAPIIVAGVASWPDCVSDLNDDPEKMKRYLLWRASTVNWLRHRWGENLTTVVQHHDEAHPHIHFVVVPGLASDRRLRIAGAHPGHCAAEKVAEIGGSSRDQKTAYKEAMGALQDDYYERVSIKFGLLRIGPRLQRLTRAEWVEKQRQAEALAQAHNRVQTFASELKAAAERDIAAGQEEADQKAQAKISAVVAQSDQRIMALKQKAVERVEALKRRVAELEDTLGEKDTIIAAQAAELDAALSLLQDNGLRTNPKI
jgi:polyhydroxyalkanoate synthesis regulator phasin